MIKEPNFRSFFFYIIVIQLTYKIKGAMSMAENEERHGRQYNQKMKPYFVFQYLMKNADENHVS